MGDGRYVTIWQQGFVLDGKDAVALGLIAENETSEKIAVVVSHDCDLIERTEIEPGCEIIVGKKTERINGIFSNAKHPRRLHLPFSAGTTTLTLELNASDKRTINKGAILALQPNAQIQLLSIELWTLRAWLASRYFRPSYPDEFDRRLKAKPGDVYKRIANTIRSTGNDLVAVLFDIDPGQATAEKAPDDVYVLGIYLVYDVSKDPARAIATAKTAAQSIKGIFRQYYLKDGKWHDIEFRDCLPISEDALSVYQLRMTRLWYFDAFEIVFEKAPASPSTNA
jgi:hypothetical protein